MRRSFKSGIHFRHVRCLRQTSGGKYRHHKTSGGNGQTNRGNQELEALRLSGAPVPLIKAKSPAYPSTSPAILAKRAAQNNLHTWPADTGQDARAVIIGCAMHACEKIGPDQKTTTSIAILRPYASASFPLKQASIQMIPGQACRRNHSMTQQSHSK